MAAEYPADEDQTLLTIDIRSIDTEGSTRAICPYYFIRSEQLHLGNRWF